MTCARRRVRLSLVLVLLLASAGTTVGASALPAAAVDRQAPAGTVDDPGTDGVEGDVAPATPGDQPAPVGRPIPPTSQRVVDNAVWVWVLACLVLGPLVVWWLSRRRPHPVADGVEATSPTGDDR